MIKNVLDLSTLHAPNADPDFGSVRYAPHKYGWIAFVSESDLDEPEWIKPILIFARKHNCIIINFDSDADTEDSFATYEW